MQEQKRPEKFVNGAYERAADADGAAEKHQRQAETDDVAERNTEHGKSQSIDQCNAEAVGGEKIRRDDAQRHAPELGPRIDGGNFDVGEDGADNGDGNKAEYGSAQRRLLLRLRHGQAV